MLFFSYADKFKHDYFISNIRNDEERQKSQENLDEMLYYGNIRTCRRRFLLNYFDENYLEKNCANCDICLPQTSRQTPKKSFIVPSPPVFTFNPENADYDKTLFEKLKNLRTEEAQRLKVPPYVVFGDKSLIQMATDLPVTEQDFLEIYGVAQQKLSQFGKQFISVIKEHKNK